MTRLRAARSVADLSGGIILATVEIAAPPERVFRALTTPEELVRWWGSPEKYRTERWTADLRPGGAWLAEGRNVEGKQFQVGGVFREVDPPRRLVMTWKAGWDQGAETVVTYELAPIDGGTRLTLRHEGFVGRPDACQDHANGWERVLGWLTGYLTAADDAQFYLCRLLPPRPSFVQDMTADEAAIMQAHAVYWRQLLEQGTAIVFGPVADPKGPWGLGVIRVADETQMRALQAGDPAIQSGKGFRYEALPMLRAVARP